MGRRHTGPDSAEAFGAARLYAQQRLTPSAIASAFAAGLPLVVKGTQLIFPTGLGSLEAFGNLKMPFKLLPPSIATAFAMGNLSVQIWTPALLGCTGWWRATYAGTPWPGNASLGSSGSRNFTAANGVNSPITGATRNGFTSARGSWNSGAPQGFTAAATSPQRFVSTKYSGYVLMRRTGVTHDSIHGDSDDPKADGDQTRTGLVFGDVGQLSLHIHKFSTTTTEYVISLFGDNGGGPQNTVNSNGFQSTKISDPNTEFFLVQYKWDSALGVGKIRINGGSPTTTAWVAGTSSHKASCNTAPSVAHVGMLANLVFDVGGSSQHSLSADFEVLDTAVSDVEWSDAEQDLVLRYCRSRYALTL